MKWSKIIPENIQVQTLHKHNFHKTIMNGNFVNVAAVFNGLNFYVQSQDFSTCNSMSVQFSS